VDQANIAAPPRSEFRRREAMKLMEWAIVVEIVVIYSLVIFLPFAPLEDRMLLLFPLTLGIGYILMLDDLSDEDLGIE